MNATVPADSMFTCSHRLTGNSGKCLELERSRRDQHSLGRCLKGCQRYGGHWPGCSKFDDR